MAFDREDITAEYVARALNRGRRHNVTSSSSDRYTELSESGRCGSLNNTGPTTPSKDSKPSPLNDFALK
jgi:hypothetical protein